MDFARIPFNSALDRFGHLLPIGTFMQLQQIVPRFQKVALIKSAFGKITVERSSTAFLSMTFVRYGDSLTVHYDSPEAVLNDRLVNCLELQLYRADDVPVEAIGCCMTLVLWLATPAVLPFLACGARGVGFMWREMDRSQTFVTFKAVVAHLGKAVNMLVMPWLAPGDSADIAQFEAPQNKDYRLKYFEMPFLTFEELTEWLRRNAHAMAHNRFCKFAILHCKDHRIGDAGTEDLELSTRPYCSHRPENNGQCFSLQIFLSNKVHIFYFVTETLCPHCLPLSNKN